MSNCNNTHKCPCLRTTCPHHGHCCDCIAAHKHTDHPTACLENVSWVKHD